MKTKFYILFLALSLISKCNYGQTFTEQTGISLVAGVGGSVAWGDYNNDGYLDILITGQDINGSVSKIYKNNGDGTFTVQTNISLIGVSSSSVAWGDYNNDGYLDILLTGSSSNGPISKIYKNNRDGTFTLQSGINLTGVNHSSVAWSDYNNDGYLDILLTGLAGSTIITKIYKNNGNGTFTEQTGLNLAGVTYGSVAWGDYNNDGYMDILLTGYNTDSVSNNVNYLINPITKVYKNNGDGTFTEQTNISLEVVGSSSLAWGDYNNDGYLDILLTGFTGTGDVSKIYKNNGDGTFTEQIGISLTGVDGSVAWGDYNNDGYIDILLTGYVSYNNYISKVYKNNGNGSFSEQTGVSLTGVYLSSVVWGDYNNDGYLDILLTGTIGSSYISKIYKNTYSINNNSPSVPTNLQ